MVFTEFIEFVEDKFGFEVSNEIIISSDLESGGIYTAVGTYDFQELVNLVTNLNRLTEIPINALLETFGDHLFYRFVEMYPQFMDNNISFFKFISQIDKYIHVEVLKLYPDAQLPIINVNSYQDDCIKLIYKSNRKMSFFALGLLKAASDYFKTPVHIEMEFIKEDGAEVQFILRKI